MVGGAPYCCELLLQDHATIGTAAQKGQSNICSSYETLKAVCFCFLVYCLVLKLKSKPHVSLELIQTVPKLYTQSAMVSISSFKIQSPAMQPLTGLSSR